MAGAQWIGKFAMVGALAGYVLISHCVLADVGRDHNETKVQQLNDFPVNQLNFLRRELVTIKNESLLSSKFFMSHDLDILFSCNKFRWDGKVYDEGGGYLVIGSSELPDNSARNIKNSLSLRITYKKVIGINENFDRLTNDDSKIENVHFVILDLNEKSDMDIRAVMRVFGNSFILSDPYKNNSIDSDFGVGTKINEFGNSKVTYTIKTEHSEAEIYFFTNGAGMVLRHGGDIRRL